MARLRPCRRWPSPELGNPEIPGQRSLVARMRRLNQSRSACNSERSAGARGRARGELKTVRLGAATRERFLEGEGEKAFWCRGGERWLASACHRVSLPLLILDEPHQAEHLCEVGLV